MLSDVELVSDDEDVHGHGRGSSKRRSTKFGVPQCIREAVPARVPIDRYEVLGTRREDEFQFMFQVSVKMIDFAHSTFEGFLNDPPLHEGPGRV